MAITVRTIPRAPLTNNQRERSHWAELRRDSKSWRAHILAAFGKRRRVDVPVSCRFDVYRASRQDPDNRDASCKPIIDALVWAGWARDDAMEWFEYEAEEHKLGRGRRREWRTEIQWSPIE